MIDQQTTGQNLGKNFTFCIHEPRLALVHRYYIGILIICSLFGFGDDFNILKNAIALKRSDDGETDGEFKSPEPTPGTFHQTLSFAVHVLEIAIQRLGDNNTLSFFHTKMVFMRHLSKVRSEMKFNERKIPWKLTTTMLTT